MKRLLLTITGVIAVTICGVVVYSIGATHRNPAVPTKTIVAPAPAAVTYNQDPRIVTVMQRLGLDYSKLNLIYGSNPKEPKAIASFTAPNNLYITDGVSDSLLNRVVSHEYIHYVEWNVNPSLAQSFYSYVTSLADNNNYLRNRTAAYRSGAACGGTCDVPAETEAIACTELSDKRMSSDFVAFCNRYLPQREALLQ